MHQGNKYFISDYTNKNDLVNGNMRNHIEQLLMELGFEKIEFAYDKNNNLFKKLIYVFKYIKVALSIKKNASIFIVYPILPTYTKIIHYILRSRKKNHIIYFMTDLDGIRNNNYQVLKKDISFIKRHDNYIALGKKMETYLLSFQKNARIENIDFHYYPIAVSKTNRQKNGAVVFAGNLEKSTFIHQLYTIPDVAFNLYGKSETTIHTTDNLDYKGFEQPSHLPSILFGSFGLVWDGQSIDTCHGSYGEYLRINLSHKISLYILATLPIIIWEQAAAASIIIQYGIGFTVASLHELRELIDNITEQQYQATLANIRSIQPRIKQGEDLKMAINNLLKE